MRAGMVKRGAARSRTAYGPPIHRSQNGGSPGPVVTEVLTETGM